MGKHYVYIAAHEEKLVSQGRDWVRSRAQRGKWYVLVIPEFYSGNEPECVFPHAGEQKYKDQYGTGIVDRYGYWHKAGNVHPRGLLRSVSGGDVLYVYVHGYPWNGTPRQFVASEDGSESRYNVRGLAALLCHEGLRGRKGDLRVKLFCCYGAQNQMHKALYNELMGCELFEYQVGCNLYVAAYSSETLPYGRRGMGKTGGMEVQDVFRWWEGNKGVIRAREVKKIQDRWRSAYRDTPQYDDQYIQACEKEIDALDTRLKAMPDKTNTTIAVREIFDLMSEDEWSGRWRARANREWYPKDPPVI